MSSIHYGLQGEYKSADNLIVEDNRTFKNVKLKKINSR